MARQKVFVSFDFDNDAVIKMFLVNQSKLEDIVEEAQIVGCFVLNVSLGTHLGP
jgi:hypothetical protein